MVFVAWIGCGAAATVLEAPLPIPTTCCSRRPAAAGGIARTLGHTHQQLQCPLCRRRKASLCQLLRCVTKDGTSNGRTRVWIVCSDVEETSETSIDVHGGRRPSTCL